MAAAAPSPGPARQQAELIERRSIASNQSLVLLQEGEDEQPTEPIEVQSIMAAADDLLERYLPGTGGFVWKDSSGDIPVVVVAATPLSGQLVEELRGLSMEQVAVRVEESPYPRSLVESTFDSLLGLFVDAGVRGMMDVNDQRGVIELVISDDVEIPENYREIIEAAEASGFLELSFAPNQPGPQVSRRSSTAGPLR